MTTNLSRAPGALLHELLHRIPVVTRSIQLKGISDTLSPPAARHSDRCCACRTRAVDIASSPQPVSTCSTTSRATTSALRADHAQSDRGYFVIVGAQGRIELAGVDERCNTALDGVCRRPQAARRRAGNEHSHALCGTRRRDRALVTRRPGSPPPRPRGYFIDLRDREGPRRVARSGSRRSLRTRRQGAG